MSIREAAAAQARLHRKMRDARGGTLFPKQDGELKVFEAIERPTPAFVVELLDALTDIERQQIIWDYCAYCGAKEHRCPC